MRVSIEKWGFRLMNKLYLEEGMDMVLLKKRIYLEEHVEE